MHASRQPRDVASGILLVLLALTYPLVQLTRTALDGVRTVRDVTGAVHFVSDGRAGPMLLLTLSLLAGLLAGHLVLSAWRRGGFVLGVWALLALVVLVAEGLRPDRDVVGLGYAGLTLLVLLAAPLLRPSQAWLARMGAVLIATAGSLLLYAVAVPGQGWAECRPDKCTVAGGLLVGYYPQENVVGMFLAALLPTVAFIRRSWARRTGLLLVVVTILLTGSRTAMAATLLALWAYAVLRRRSDPTRHHGDLAKVVGVLPLLSLAVSTMLVFTLSDLSLTGRGLIFRIVREGWQSSPMLGPGRSVLEDAYYASTVNWYLAHEHGQAPYLLAETGLVGLLLGFVALIVLAVACWVARGPVPAVFALVPALGFLTEPTWEITLRSPYVASLVLTVALVAAALRHSPLPAPAPALTTGPSVPSPVPQARERLPVDLDPPPGR